MKASFIRSLLCIAIFAIPHVHFGASKVYNDFGAWFSSEVVGNTVDLEFYTPLIPSSSSNSLDTSYPTVSGSGYALKFSPGNYARIPNLSVGNKFTVSMWVKFDTEIKSNGSRQDIMYGINYARPHLSANRESDGKIGFYTQQQNSQRDIKTTKSQWDANKWYHLAFTFKSGEQKVYVNGILDASYSYNGGFTNWGGVTLSRSSGGFSGALDELSVWSDNLNQSTIQGLINSKITNSHSKLNKLQAYFRFDYGTGNTLYDLSKNANGTLHYTSSSKWVVSGAPIGDTSNISIGSSASASIIMNNGGAFTASASQGFSSNEGIQIYYSQSAPNVTTLPTGVDSIFSSFGYIGVNKIGDPTDQYTVVANYSSISGLSNTQKKYLVLLKRENDLDSTWEIATNASHNNLSTGVITLPGQTGTQYVLGTVNAFTDATVYFTNQSAGTILKVKNNGTGFGTIASSLSGASSIAYDATNDFAFVYRANTIIRMKGDGTSQTTIVTGQSSTRDVLVDPDNQVIYFSDYNGGTIKKCSYTGSGLTTVKSGIQPLGIYLDITNQVIYWADLGGSYIGKVNVDGTGTTTLVTGQADIRDVAYDDVNNTLYWCRGNQNTLYKKVGTGSATSLITGASGIYGIDLDVENQVLYWAEYSTGRIKIARTDGTNNTTLYTSSGPLYVSFGRKGEQGGALAFDGSNDYVALADTVGNTGMKELSIEAWIKVASSTGNFQAIVSNAGNNFIHFQAYSAGNIAVYTDNGAIYLPIIPETPYGVWKHVAVTVKSGESKVYVNGVQVGSTVTTAFNSINVDNNNSIGRGFSSTRYFKGEIDEVRIWNRALCQVEIQSRLSCSLDTASAAGLLSYYDFANGVAGGTNTGLTTLLDNSGNGHNGTLTNLALTGTASNWVSQSDSVSFNSCGAFSNTSSPVIVADKNPQVYINSSGTANVSTASLYTSASVGCGSITSVVASDTSFGCNDAIDSLPVTSGVLTFDGTNDYVTLGASGTLKPTSNVTVEAWVYMNSWTGAPTFVGNTQGSGYAIYQASNNKVRFIARRNGTYGLVENSTVLSSGWHHIAGTYDGRYCRLYVDGNLVGTDDAGGNYSIQYVGNSTLIGAEVSGGTAPTGGYLNGKMDEVRIWNVARTSSQIQSAYKSSLTGNESGLLAYYDFEDGNGSTLTDQAGSLNGSLVNMNTSSVWGAENVYTYYGIPVVLTATDNASNQVKDTVYVNLVDTIAPTLSLTTNTSKRIGIIGPLGSYGAYWSQLSAAFAAQGHTVAFSQTGAASASQLTNLDYLFVFRVNAAVNNDVKTWVNNGGFLFAEWDATNVFNLGMLSGSHGSTFNTNANLNWQSTTLANQIKAGMSSPTNMSTGSGYYRQVNVSGSTEIHAVRAANSGEVLLAGAAYGSGYAMVCGAALPDLANSFPNSDQEKMFKNLVGTGSTVNLLPDTLYLNASGTATIPTSGLSSAAADNCGTPTVSIVGGATLDCDDIGGSGFSTGSEFWYHSGSAVYSSSVSSPSAQSRFSLSGNYATVAYDYSVNKVFYLNPSNKSIYKSDPNGSNAVLLYTGISTSYNLIIDPTNQRVFASDWGGQKIVKVNYDGTGGAVVKSSLGHNPMGIAYDEVNDILYWGDWNSSGIIRSIKPDGSAYNSNVFTISGAGNCGGLRIDPSTNTFYFASYTNGIIYKKVGSNSPTTIISGLSSLWNMDLDRANGKLYYSRYTFGIIGSVNIDGTSNTNLLTGLSTNNLSVSLSKGSGGSGSSNSVVVKATDRGNNSVYDTTHITVLDTISPTLSLRNDTLYLNSNGTTDTLTASDLIVSASDNCGIADTTLDSLGYFTCSSAGIDSLSITVTDSSDNSTTAFAYITVLDTLSPTISCASNVSASSSVNCNAVVSVPSPNVVDNCGSCSTAPFDSSNTNLMVWLDATKYNGTHNSSLSGIMTDVSGYTRSITTDATYESTGLNGKPAMLHNNNRTIVGNNFTTTANTYVFIALEMTGYGTATASTFHHGSRDYGVVLEKNGGSTQWHFQTGNDNTNVNQNISLNTPYIMACKLENNNQRSFTLYKNDGSGNLQNLGTVSNSSFNVQIGSGVFYIGKSDVNEYSQMKLGEFIYFQNSVPVADSIIVNYLFDKWLSNSTSASTCDGITLTNNFNNTADASGTYPLGSTKVIWTATDASGNSDTCSMYVTVNPSSNSFTVKTDTFYLDSNGTARIIADSLYTGNCGGLTVNLSDTTAYCTDLSGLGGAGSTGDSLYFRTSSSKIGGSSLTNPGIVDLSSTTINTYAVEFDANVKKVFYMDLSNARIVKSNSDGSGLVSLATGISSCYDIELDPINQVVYWVEYRGSRRIMKVNYDGTGLTTLGTVSYSVFGFHFDIASQTLVFSDWNGGGKIGKINADGTGKNEAIFNTGHGSIANVNYNSSTDTYYWSVYSGTGSGTIHKRVGTGGATTTVIGSLGNILGFDIDFNNSKIYFIDWNSYIVKRVDLDGSNLITFLSGMGYSSYQLSLAKTGFGSGTTKAVYLTVTDTNSSSFNDTTYVTILDTISPNVNASNDTVFLNQDGLVILDSINVVPGGIGGSNVSDNCAVESLTYSQDTLTIQHLGANSIAVTVTDSSGNSFTDSVIVFVKDGDAPYAGLGNKLYFDGSNDRVDIAHDASLNLNSFTAEAWFRTTQTAGSYKRILIKRVSSGGQNYSLAIHNGKPHVRMDASGGKQAEGSDNVNDGLWHHIAGVHNTSTNELILYLDGNEVAKTTGVLSPSTGSFPLSIGGASGFSQNFEGDLDEIRVWNVAKTAQDIKDNYRIRANSSDPSLVAYYNFDSEVGLALNDVSSNSNHGTLVNMASNLWTDSHDSLVWEYNENEVIHDTVAWATAWDKIEGDSLTFYPISGFGSLFTLDSITGAITFDGIFDYEEKSTYPLMYGVYDLSGNIDTAVSVVSVIDDTTEVVYAGMGNALSFDNVNDKVSIPHNTAYNTSEFTISTWVYWEGSGATVDFISGKGLEAYEIHTGGDAGVNSIRFIPAVGVWLDAPVGSFEPNKWNHVAVAYKPSGGMAKIYINGKDVGYTNRGMNGLTSSIPNSTDPLTIGNRHSSANFPFEGSIDEYQLWDRMLDSNEVVAVMNRRGNLADSDLVLNLNFDKNSGVDKVTDLTANGNNGQLVGFSGNPWGDGPDSLFFRISEETPTGDTVAYALGFDSDGSDLSFRFISGNTRNSFNLDSLTGVITVQDVANLKYYVDSSYVLEYEVIENGDGNRDTAYIDIRLNNENAPPAISFIGNDTICAAGIGDSLLFSITDLDPRDSTAMVLTAHSYDTLIIPNSSVVFYNTTSGDSGRAMRIYLPDSAVSTQSVKIDIVVTDLAGLSDTTQITVLIDSLPSIDLGIDTTFCYNTTFTINSGSGKGTYVWNTSASSDAITINGTDRNTFGDTYYVGITDANGCFNSDTVIVDTLQVPAVLITAKRNVFCKTDSTGLAAATITGGVKPYVYQWNDYAAQTDSLAEFLPAGTYKVLVTDSNNCQDSITQVITEPNMALTLSLIDSVKPLCSTDTVGWISVNSAGGTPGYSYLWNDNLSQTDTLADGLTPGTYGVTVTDILGCKDSATQTLSEIDSLTASFTLSKDVFCNTDTFITLSGLPANDGVFAGAGVSGNSFRPFSTTVGQHVISYTRMLRSCMAVGYDTLVVNPNPVASITNFTTVCNNTPTFALSQGRPFGGVYYGTRITSDSIYSAPSVAGFDTVNYVYTNGFGCKDSATRVITISPKPTVAFASLANVCADTVPFTLTQGSPVSGGSGFYTGVAVNNGKFYTSIAGVGVDTLTYHFTTNIGCTDSAAQTITVDSLPVPVITSTYTDKCINEPSFALNNILPLGGTYSGNGVTSNTFSPSSAATGTHTIAWNFTDGNGCKADTSLPITVRPKPTVSFASLNDVCLDVTPFNLSAGSPTGGYYKGSGVQSDSISFNPSAAGAGSKALTYVFENTYGCIDSAAGTQLVDTLPNVYFTQSLPTICLNDRNTAINFGTPASQGLGVYSGKGVVGNNIFTAQSGSGIHVVTYTFTDNNGCTSFADTSILVDTVPTVTLATFAPVCADLDSVQLIGGSPSNGVYFGSSLISNPSGNNYYLDVNTGGARTDTLFYTFTNANGCSDTVNQLFVVNPLPIVSLNLGFDSICRNTPTLSLSGGSPAGGVYSGPGINNGNFNSNGAAIGNNAIVYTYTNSNSCTARDTDYVRVDSIPLINLSSVLPRYCQTDAPDTLRVGTGLTANGSAWYTGRGILTDGLRFSAVAAGTGNHAVTYNYSVKGCVNDTTFNVRVNANPIVNLSPINAVCENADTFKLTGGSPVGSSGVYKGTGVTNGFFYPSVAQNGNYTIKYVYVNPATQCRDSASRVVSVYQAPKVTMTAFSQLCSDAAPFKLTQGTTTSSSGGSATYKGTGVNQADTTFNPAVAGAGAHEIWYVHSDTNGCADSTSKYLAVNPVPITTFSSVGNVCQNKAAFPLTQGTTFSFNAKSDEYYKIGGVKLPGNSMFNPASYPGNSTLSVTYVFEDVKGCVDSSVQTIKVDTTPIVNFAPLNGFCTNQGTYRLVEGTPVSGGTGYYYGQSVLGGIFFPQFMGPGSNTLSYVFTNLNGCSDTASTGVLVKSAPVISLSALASICENEDTLLLNTASVTPTAGYGNYFGTGIDSTGGNVIRIDSLSVGSYLIKYVHQDTVGGFTCSDSAFQSLIVNAKPTIYLKTAPELCETESKLLNFGIPTGGMYYDSTGVGIAQNTFIGSTFGVGTHKVVYEYSDINGCTDTASSFIDVLASPSVSLNMPDNSFCLATGIVSLSGGQPKGGNYSGNGIFQNQLYTSSAGLGTHRVVYRYQDSTGCSSSDTSQLVIVPNPKVVVSNDTVICSNSRIKLYASGLGLRATYDWGNGLVQDSITVNPNSTTTYKVIATDSNSCSANGKVRVEVNPEIILTTSSQNSACGESTGAATVLATGGLPPFQYLWSNGVKQTLNKALKSGVYVVTVSDGNNCNENAAVTISDIGGVQITVNTVTNPTCFGGDDGSIDINIIGSATKIEWSNGYLNEDLSNVAAGKYTVKVTDSKGCLTIKEFTLEDPDKLVAEAVVSKPSCGDTNGVVALNVAGGTGGYVFTWNDGSSNDSLVNITSGLYSVEIKDGNNCSDSVFVSVADSGAPVIALKRLVPTNCGTNDGEISIVVSSDSLKNVLWSNGDSITTIVGLASGRYNVTATDLAGCQSQAYYKVNLILPGSQPICVTTIDTATGLSTVIQNATGNITKVRLYSVASGTDDLIKLQEVPNTQNKITDFAVSFSAGAKTYGMTVIDACGNESEVSSLHSPIYLTSSIDARGNISLQWSNYNGFTIVDYEVVRMTDKGNVVVRTIPYPTNSTVIADETFEGTFIKYFVRAAAPSNCSSDPYYDYTWSNLSADFAGFETKIANVQMLGGYRIYPNPNKGEFKIELLIENATDVSVTVQDVSGRKIHANVYENMTGFNVIPMQVAGLANGMYQVIIETGEGERIIEKIQVTR